MTTDYLALARTLPQSELSAMIDALDYSMRMLGDGEIGRRLSARGYTRHTDALGADYDSKTQPSGWCLTERGVAIAKAARLAE